MLQLRKSETRKTHYDAFFVEVFSLHILPFAMNETSALFFLPHIRCTYARTRNVI